jgi:hypothetical protein
LGSERIWRWSLFKEFPKDDGHFGCGKETYFGTVETGKLNPVKAWIWVGYAFV